MNTPRRAGILESLLPSPRSPSFEEAVELNWCSWVMTHSLPPESGFLTREEDNIRVITGEPDGFLNWVAWSDIPAAAMDTRIEEISADIQRRVPGRGVSCEWSVLGTQPNRRQLIEALVRSGWEFFYEVPGMTCNLTANECLLDDVSWEFRVVRTSRDVSLWLHPFMEAFGIHEQSRGHLQKCFELIAADAEHPFQHFLLGIVRSINFRVISAS